LENGLYCVMQSSTPYAVFLRAGHDQKRV